MVRKPSYDKNGIKKGAWSQEEDNMLRNYVARYGQSNWRELPKYAGLKRCGKSCRLRWMNYLRPDVKLGSYTKEEEDLIIKLYNELGSKWSRIAANLPGRTDNEIKNHWHTHLKKRAKQLIVDSQLSSSSKGGHNDSDVPKNNIPLTPDMCEAIASQIVESSYFSPQPLSPSKPISGKSSQTTCTNHLAENCILSHKDSTGKEPASDDHDIPVSEEDDNFSDILAQLGVGPDASNFWCGDHHNLHQQHDGFQFDQNLMHETAPFSPWSPIYSEMFQEFQGH